MTGNWTLPDMYPLFVDVHGEVVCGWVGLGLFTFLAVFIAPLWTYLKFIPVREEGIYVSVFAYALALVYMLAAQEQFVLEIDGHKRINLLMLVVNAIVWYVAVVKNGQRVSKHFVDDTLLGWASRIAVLAQVGFVSGGLVWGSHVGPWVMSSVPLLVSLMMFLVPLFRVETRREHYIWMVSALALTFMYILFLMLSHANNGPFSLAGAMGAYLGGHLVSWSTTVILFRYAPNSVGRQVRTQNMPGLSSADDA